MGEMVMGGINADQVMIELDIEIHMIEITMKGEEEVVLVQEKKETTVSIKQVTTVLITTR